MAGLLAGVWDRIEDLPIGAIETRVNGWRIDGDGPEDRWIPLDVAVRSTLREDQRPEVPEEAGAKGPTARISGEISSRDPIFARTDWGVYFGQLARAWSIDSMIGIRADIAALEERIAQREGNQEIALKTVTPRVARRTVFDTDDTSTLEPRDLKPLEDCLQRTSDREKHLGPAR